MTRTVFRESEFVIIPPHGNEGGHARAANFSGFQAPPKYKRIVELLYSHPDIQWRTEADVLRAFLDLGSRHFGALVTGKEGRVIAGILQQLDMMNELVRAAREANDFADSIDQLEREVKRLEEGGMRESAVGLVFKYRDMAKQLQDKILRRKVVGDINQRFGYLLRGKQGRKDHEAPSARLVVDPDIHDEDVARHDDD